mmetsp:Transcript_51246/g.119122  ORF Transcript_51246/g.119122 Transcript_51246/m.119122 type:complete len:539 (-) Transcript_51246:174-1790(-)
MSIMRMNMGQKASAKTVAKVAFTSQARVSPSPRSHDNPDGFGNEESPIPKRDSSHGGGGRRASTSSVRSGTRSVSGTSQLCPAAPADDNSDQGDTDMRMLDHRIKSLQQQQLASAAEEGWMRRFNLTMGALIILNIIVIAIETDSGYDDAGATIEGKIAWLIIDSLFVLIFISELGVRGYVEGREWFYSLWNWFDVLIIVIAIVDIWIISLMQGEPYGVHIMTIFRIVRLVRLVRLVKLVRLLHGLYVILMAFWHAMQTMSFLLAIMLFGLMIYAIFATNIIGRNTYLIEKGVQIKGDPIEKRFGSVYRSMYSLFELMTLEGWEDVARPIVEEQPFLFVFIVSFIMIFTFGMLNMIVALVIEKTLHHTRMMSEHALQAEREQMADELIRIQTLFSNGRQAVGTITYEEFETALQESDAVRKIFSAMGIELNDVRELYTVLDWDESGDLTVKEFLEGLRKLQEGVPSPWDSLATHSIVRSIKGTVIQMSEKLAWLSAEQATWRNSMEERMDVQAKTLEDIVRRLNSMGAPSPRGWETRH